MDSRRIYRIDAANLSNVNVELKTLRSSVLAENEEDAIGELSQKTRAAIQSGFNDLLHQIRTNDGASVVFSPWFFTETALDDELTPDLFVEDVARRAGVILEKYADVTVIPQIS